MTKSAFTIVVPDAEMQLTAIRSMGSGGQNVNKVATAIHLRFDIAESSLPERCKEKLLAMSDSRITKEGVIVIKAQSYRTQEQNRDDAKLRLLQLINSVAHEAKKRKPTRPSFSAKMKRVDTKKRKGTTKNLRGKVDFND
jgi:ribosome-associated protein